MRHAPSRSFRGRPGHGHPTAGTRSGDSLALASYRSAGRRVLVALRSSNDVVGGVVLRAVRLDSDHLQAWYGLNGGACRGNRLLEGGSGSHEVEEVAIRTGAHQRVVAASLEQRIEDIIVHNADTGGANDEVVLWMR